MENCYLTLRGSGRLPLRRLHLRRFCDWSVTASRVDKREFSHRIGTASLSGGSLTMEPLASRAGRVDVAAARRIAQYREPVSFDNGFCSGNKRIEFYPDCSNIRQAVSVFPVALGPPTKSQT
jgi:hypothetical protein